MDTITIEKKPMIEERQHIFEDMDGRAIVIKDRISYLEKERFAMSLAERTIVIDGESGVAYRSHQYELVKTFLFAKFYTNIETDGLDDEEGHMLIFDYLCACGAKDWNDMPGHVASDLCDMESIYQAIYDAVLATTHEKNSLGYKIKTSFASVLNDENLTESLAKSQIVNEKMIDLLGAAMKNGYGRQSENAQRKVPAVRVGDNVVRFAKK